MSSSPLKKEKSFTDLSKEILDEGPSGFQNPIFEVEKNSKTEHLIPEIIISDLNATLETIPEGTGDETSEINSNDSNEILVENDVSKSENKNIERDFEKSDDMKIGMNIKCENNGISNPVFDYVTCEEQLADEIPVTKIKEIPFPNTKSFERVTSDEKLEDKIDEENDLNRNLEAKNKSETFKSNGVAITERKGSNLANLDEKISKEPKPIFEYSIVKASTVQNFNQSEGAQIGSENLKVSDIQQKLFTQMNIQKQPTQNKIFDEKSEIVNKKYSPESFETSVKKEEKDYDLEISPGNKISSLAVLNKIPYSEAAKIEEKLEKTNGYNKGEPWNLESHKDKVPRSIEKQGKPNLVHQFDPENHSFENPNLPEVDINNEFSNKTVESKNKLDENLVLEAVKNQIEIEKAQEGDKERADNLIKIVHETVKTDIDETAAYSNVDTRNKLDEDFENEPEKVPEQANKLIAVENTVPKQVTKKKSAKRRNKKKR